MISLGFRESQGNYTLFTKHSPDGKLTLLLVYVDNMIIAGGDVRIVYVSKMTQIMILKKLTLEEKLATQFEMKELGKLKYFLGIEVAYSKQGIFISQRKYVLNLLKKQEKWDAKL
ncbi:putative mitochondrial protein, partial [Mucuna pruriens]